MAKKKKTYIVTWQDNIYYERAVEATSEEAAIVFADKNQWDGGKYETGDHGGPSDFYAEEQEEDD